MAIPFHKVVSVWQDGCNWINNRSRGLKRLRYLEERETVVADLDCISPEGKLEDFRNRGRDRANSSSTATEWLNSLSRPH